MFAWKSAPVSSALAVAVAAILCGTVALAAPIGLVTPVPVPAPSSASASGEYIIHSNDELNIQVFGDTSLSQAVTVLPSGDISYPLIGRVHVAGETPEQASRTIASALKTYVRNPVVTVILAQQGEINVLVLGGVQHVGKYQLTSSARLSDAVAAAGGLIGTAQAYPTAKVTDYSGRFEEVSLEKLYGDGDTTQDVPVTDGSIVYIPSPATIDVEVSGAVDHPGEIEMSQGDRLSMAIAKAGNSDASDGDLNNITLTRTDPSGQVQKFNVNLYDALQKGETSADLTLQKGDVVFVPKSKHGINGNGQSDPVYLLLLGLRSLFTHI